MLHLISFALLIEGKPHPSLDWTASTRSNRSVETIDFFRLILSHSHYSGDLFLLPAQLAVKKSALGQRNCQNGVNTVAVSLARLSTSNFILVAELWPP